MTGARMALQGVTCAVLLLILTTLTGSILEHSMLSSIPQLTRERIGNSFTTSISRSSLWITSSSTHVIRKHSMLLLTATKRLADFSSQLTADENGVRVPILRMKLCIH